MNDKEAREIRRRFKPDKTWINAVHGCYVNESGKVISTFRESVQTMVQDESERFLALLKKPISGTIGRNLINLEFSARQVMESEEHKLLMAMRACGLENEELLAAFYNRVAQTLNIDGGYIILLVHDTYSVPYRSSDGHAQHDASDEEFSYFICSICPVKQTQPVLSYQLAENCFNALNNGFAVSAPQLGFMFPAFDNRAANIYATLYYTKSTADNHPEFTTAVFGIEPPMPAASQKEVFSEILSNALEEECRIETVQSVQEHIGQIIEMHKESRAEEPLARLAPRRRLRRGDKREIGELLAQEEFRRRERDGAFVRVHRRDNPVAGPEGRDVDEDYDARTEPRKILGGYVPVASVDDERVGGPVQKVRQCEVRRVRLGELRLPCGVRRDEAHDAADHAPRGGVADIETDQNLLQSLHGELL